MNNIVKYIADYTKGDCYQSHKYPVESTENSGIIYDDHQDLEPGKDKIGETDQSLQNTKSLTSLARKISAEQKPLFRYFLDGSRKTYKIDDIAYNNRLFPIIAGQVGVGCCIRENPSTFRKAVFNNYYIIVLPACANKDNTSNEKYFNELKAKINELPTLEKRKIGLKKIIEYSDSRLLEGENYENKGIAKIHEDMMEGEKLIVKQLVDEKRLNIDSYLLKDGSLQYQKTNYGDLKDLSSIKSNYQCVVGVSKSFNPELCKDNKNKSIAKKIADLKVDHRTPAFKYTTDRAPGVLFSVWYLRIRDIKRTISPFDGVLKVEKILITDDQQEKGLDSDEIDFISANLINEKNPTCYGSDKRWANHLYPIYLTEYFIKSNFLSDQYFLHLF